MYPVYSESYGFSSADVVDARAERAKRRRAVEHPSQPLPRRDRHPCTPCQPRAVSRSGYRGKRTAFIPMVRCYATRELTEPAACPPKRAAGSGHYIFLMPTQQLLDRVRELREAGRTPKEIARALKMPPSAIAPLIRSVAAAEGRTREDALIGCWISPGWSSSVQAPEPTDWPGSVPVGITYLDKRSALAGSLLCGMDAGPRGP